MMQKIQVLIADDHALLRAGLRMLIDSKPDMEVVGEAADSDEALSEARRLNPNVVLLDISMPGKSGLRALPSILQHCPRTRVLMLTMHEDSAYVKSALAGGASGYIIKKAADSDLISAIRAVHNGRIFIDSSQSDSNSLSSHFFESSGNQRAQVLSNREREVLKLLAHGHTHQEIAEKIFISVKTVETYRTRITSKLNLHTRADMVRYALELGLLTREEDP